MQSYFFDGALAARLDELLRFTFVVAVALDLLALVLAGLCAAEVEAASVVAVSGDAVVSEVTVFLAPAARNADFGEGHPRPVCAQHQAFLFEVQMASQAK
jgi:hypothetical protein